MGSYGAQNAPKHNFGKGCWLRPNGLRIEFIFGKYLPLDKSNLHPKGALPKGELWGRNFEFYAKV